MITAMTKISLNLIRFEYKITFNRIKTENDLFAKIKNSYSVIFFSDKQPEQQKYIAQAVLTQYEYLGGVNSQKMIKITMLTFQIHHEFFGGDFLIFKTCYMCFNALV